MSFTISNKYYPILLSVKLKYILCNDDSLVFHSSIATTRRIILVSDPLVNEAAKGKGHVRWE